MPDELDPVEGFEGTGTIRDTEALALVVVEVAAPMIFPAGGMSPTGEAVVETVPVIVRAYEAYGIVIIEPNKMAANHL